MTLVLQQKLQLFMAQMLDKMIERKNMHPGNTVADDGFDWQHYPLGLIEDHLKKEIRERFPEAYVNGAVVPTDDWLSEWEKMQEDIDVANLAFLDWAMRKARHG